MDIQHLQKSAAVVVSVGGQIPNNLAVPLEEDRKSDPQVSSWMRFRKATPELFQPRGLLTVAWELLSMMAHLLVTWQNDVICIYVFSFD